MNLKPEGIPILPDKLPENSAPNWGAVIKSAWPLITLAAFLIANWTRMEMSNAAMNARLDTLEKVSVRADVSDQQRARLEDKINQLLDASKDQSGQLRELQEKVDRIR